jgi:hypothetical protein
MASACAGQDKHWGGLMAAINVDGQWGFWRRCSERQTIDEKENTNTGAKYRQYQRMRTEPLVFDIEGFVPAPTVDASTFVQNLKVGKVLTSFECSLYDAAYVAESGPYYIRETNVDKSWDDFTTLRLTVRGSGYNSPCL